jgi:hypothetical protein
LGDREEEKFSGDRWKNIDILKSLIVYYSIERLSCTIKLRPSVKLNHKKQTNFIKTAVMRRKLLFFILLLAIISCNSLTSEEKEIKATLGKSVETGIFSFVQEGNSFIPYSEFRRRYRHISLVYLEDGCRPCFPKYIEWQTRMDTMDLNHDFTVLFVINGMSFDGFLGNLLESNPEYDFSKDRFHVIMDSEQQFLDANRDIPRQILDKSLLIDKENKIRLIGHPFASPKIEELFYRICGEAE